jgi:hypothetical protein
MFNFFFVTFEYDVVELENRLLSRFDAASQRRDLSTMSECAKILSQVNALFCSMPLYISVGKPVLLSKILSDGLPNVSSGYILVNSTESCHRRNGCLVLLLYICS